MKKILVSILITWVALGAGNALAADPWQWKLTLKGDKAGAMLSPSAIFIDQVDDRYYVVDAGKNNLVSFDRDGLYLGFFTADNDLQVPYDMVREPGRIWVVEKGRNSLTEIDLKTKKIDRHTISDNGITIYIDRLAKYNDSFYLLDSGQGQVLEINSGYAVSRRFNCGECSGGFVDFKLDENGMVWALDQKNGTIVGFNAQGQVDTRVVLDKGILLFPRSFAIDQSGLFYVLDRHQGKIGVFDRGGRLKYWVLERGHARGLLDFPIEIQFDAWGRLCVVDEGNGRIQIFGRD